jgi:hypothetical protein
MGAWKEDPLAALGVCPAFRGRTEVQIPMALREAEGGRTITTSAAWACDYGSGSNSQSSVRCNQNQIRIAFPGEERSVSRTGEVHPKKTGFGSGMGINQMGMGINQMDMLARVPEGVWVLTRWVWVLARWVCWPVCQKGYGY